MYDKILVPLDGSPLSELVLPYVRALGEISQCPLELVRAFDPVPEEMADPLHGVYIDRLAENFRNQAVEYLDRIKMALPGFDNPITTSAHEGDAATHIVSHAANSPNALIAMSTHGRSGVSRWVLGSVTDKVLQATTNPLPIIRARPQEGFSADAVATRSERWPTSIHFKNIITPVDGSSLAEQVLPQAAALAKAMNAKVTAVRVASSSSDPEAIAYLQTVAEKLKNEGAPDVDERVLHGNVANAIIDLSHELPESLVAMTSHGRSGVERWVMGSVTDRVVRHSGAPVLITRNVS